MEEGFCEFVVPESIYNLQNIETAAFGVVRRRTQVSKASPVHRKSISVFDFSGLQQEHTKSLTIRDIVENEGNLHRQSSSMLEYLRNNSFDNSIYSELQAIDDRPQNLRSKALHKISTARADKPLSEISSELAGELKQDTLAASIQNSLVYAIDASTSELNPSNISTTTHTNTACTDNENRALDTILFGDLRGVYHQDAGLRAPSDLPLTLSITVKDQTAPPSPDLFSFDSLEAILDKYNIELLALLGLKKLNYGSQLRSSLLPALMQSLERSGYPCSSDALGLETKDLLADSLDMLAFVRIYDQNEQELEFQNADSKPSHKDPASSSSSSSHSPVKTAHFAFIVLRKHLSNESSPFITLTPANQSITKPTETTDFPTESSALIDTEQTNNDAVGKNPSLSTHINLAQIVADRVLTKNKPVDDLKILIENEHVCYEIFQFYSTMKNKLIAVDAEPTHNNAQFILFSGSMEEAGLDLVLKKMKQKFITGDDESGIFDGILPYLAQSNPNLVVKDRNLALPARWYPKNLSLPPRSNDLAQFSPPPTNLSTTATSTTQLRVQPRIHPQRSSSLSSTPNLSKKASMVGSEDKSPGSRFTLNKRPTTKIQIQVSPATNTGSSPKETMSAVRLDSVAADSQKSLSESSHARFGHLFKSLSIVQNEANLKQILVLESCFGYMMKAKFLWVVYAVLTQNYTGDYIFIHQNLRVHELQEFQKSPFFQHMLRFRKKQQLLGDSTAKQLVGAQHPCALTSDLSSYSSELLSMKFFKDDILNLEGSASLRRRSKEPPLPLLTKDNNLSLTKTHPTKKEEESMYNVNPNESDKSKNDDDDEEEEKQGDSINTHYCKSSDVIKRQQGICNSQKVLNRGDKASTPGSLLFSSTKKGKNYGGTEFIAKHLLTMPHQDLIHIIYTFEDYVEHLKEKLVTDRSYLLDLLSLESSHYRNIKTSQEDFTENLSCIRHDLADLEQSLLSIEPAMSKLLRRDKFRRLQSKNYLLLKNYLEVLVELQNPKVINTKYEYLKTFDILDPISLSKAVTMALVLVEQINTVNAQLLATNMASIRDILVILLEIKAGFVRKVVSSIDTILDRLRDPEWTSSFIDFYTDLNSILDLSGDHKHRNGSLGNNSSTRHGQKQASQKSKFIKIHVQLLQFQDFVARFAKTYAPNAFSYIKNQYALLTSRIYHKVLGTILEACEANVVSKASAQRLSIQEKLNKYKKILYEMSKVQHQNYSQFFIQALDSEDGINLANEYFLNVFCFWYNALAHEAEFSNLFFGIDRPPYDDLVPVLILDKACPLSSCDYSFDSWNAKYDTSLTMSLDRSTSPLIYFTLPHRALYLKQVFNGGGNEFSNGLKRICSAIKDLDIFSVFYASVFLEAIGKKFALLECAMLFQDMPSQYIKTIAEQGYNVPFYVDVLFECKAIFVKQTNAYLNTFKTSIPAWCLHSLCLDPSFYTEPSQPSTNTSQSSLSSNPSGSCFSAESEYCGDGTPLAPNPAVLESLNKHFSLLNKDRSLERYKSTLRKMDPTTLPTANLPCFTYIWSAVPYMCFFFTCAVRNMHGYTSQIMGKVGNKFDFMLQDLIDSLLELYDHPLLNGLELEFELILFENYQLLAKLLARMPTLKKIMQDQTTLSLRQRLCFENTLLNESGNHQESSAIKDVSILNLERPVREVKSYIDRSRTKLIQLIIKDLFGDLINFLNVIFQRFQSSSTGHGDISSQRLNMAKGSIHSLSKKVDYTELLRLVKPLKYDVVEEHLREKYERILSRVAFTETADYLFDSLTNSLQETIDKVVMLCQNMGEELNAQIKLMVTAKDLQSICSTLKSSATKAEKQSKSDLHSKAGGGLSFYGKDSAAVDMQKRQSRTTASSGSPLSRRKRDKKTDVDELMPLNAQSPSTTSAYSESGSHFDKNTLPTATGGTPTGGKLKRESTSSSSGLGSFLRSKRQH